MPFNLAGLADYTREHNLPLLRKSLFGSRTAELIKKAGTIQTGIKSADALNLMDTDAVLQSGNCEFNSSGTTTLTQRELKVADLKVNESLCPRDLEKKWTQHDVVSGSAPDAVPYEEVYTTRKADRVARQLENLIWKGDTSSGSDDFFDGYIKHLDDADNYVTANANEETAITKANVEAIIDEVYEEIPSDVIAEGDVHIFVGDDVYRKYVMALKDSNLFHFAPDGSNLDFSFPADARVTISAVYGLNGTDRVVAGRANNFFIGVDLEDEEEKFELWYSKDNRQVRFAMDFKYGTQIAFPEQVVMFVPFEA